MTSGEREDKVSDDVELGEVRKLGRNPVGQNRMMTFPDKLLIRGLNKHRVLRDVQLSAEGP